jgi:hypothetical protein
MDVYCVCIFVNVDIRRMNPSLIALNMVYRLPVVGVSVSDRLVTFFINSNAESVTPYLYILLSSETDDLFIDIEEVSLFLDMKPIEKNPA